MASRALPRFYDWQSTSLGRNRNWIIIYSPWALWSRLSYTKSHPRQGFPKEIGGAYSRPIGPGDYSWSQPRNLQGTVVEQRDRWPLIDSECISTFHTLRTVPWSSVYQGLTLGHLSIYLRFDVTSNDTICINFTLAIFRKQRTNYSSQHNTRHVVDASGGSCTANNIRFENAKNTDSSRK